MARRVFRARANRPPRKSYLYLKKLTASGWYDELFRIWDELDQLGHSLAPKYRNILAWGEGENRQHVSVVEKIVEIKTGKETGVMVNLQRLPALVIYLDAPDDKIIEAVKNELLNRRGRFGKHLNQRGPKTINSRFDTAIFNKWIGSQIVKLADLFIWNAQEKKAGRGELPDWRLGDFLGFSAKKTSQTRTTLSEVLESLPALKKQLEN